MQHTPVYAATLTGQVDLIAPEAITIEAMAHGLANINRFAGALETPFSVAQHSLLVGELARQRNPGLIVEGVVLYALLHDGHEYIIGDVITPFVDELARRLPGADYHVANIKAEIDVAIRAQLRLPEPSTEIRAAVHEADQIAATTEWRSHMSAANGPPPSGWPAPARIKLKPLSWPLAASRFRAELERELLIFHAEKN